MIIKCRIIPVVVEAVKLEKTDDSYIEVLKFVYQKNVNKASLDFDNRFSNCLVRGGIHIYTRDLNEFLRFGNYIIRDNEGTLRICTAEFFKKNYERVHDLEFTVKEEEKP